MIALLRASGDCHEPVRSADAARLSLLGARSAVQALEALTSETNATGILAAAKSIRGDRGPHLCGRMGVKIALKWHGTSPTALLSGEPYPAHRVDPQGLGRERSRGAVVHRWTGRIGPRQRHQYAAQRVGRRDTAFWQMLQHVVNHASYHGGQVTTMLRRLGSAPGQVIGHDRVLP